MFILKYIRVHLCLWDRCPDIPEETGSITIMPHDRINAINLHSLVVNHPFNGKIGPRSCKMPMAQHNRATRPLTEGIKLSAVSFILSALFTSKFHWDFSERGHLYKQNEIQSFLFMSVFKGFRKWINELSPDQAAQFPYLPRQVKCTQIHSRATRSLKYSCLFSFSFDLSFECTSGD